MPAAPLKITAVCVFSFCKSAADVPSGLVAVCRHCKPFSPFWPASARFCGAFWPASAIARLVYASNANARRLHGFACRTFCAVSSVLGLIASLLVCAHQKFQRVFLHHAVGILRQKRFQTADFGRCVLLPHGAHVGVIFGRIFDLFFLRHRRIAACGACGAACGLARTLRHRRGSLRHWRCGSMV